MRRAHNHIMLKKNLPILLIIGCILFSFSLSVLRTQYDLEHGTTQIGSDFTLTDASTGAPLSSTNYRGKYLLVYFGYSFCPDVCPTGLSRITQALQRLPAPQQAKLQPFFITVDPARDTPSALKEYISHFTPVIALTGKQEDLDAVAKSFGVYAKRLPPAADGSYSVDHSSYIYLMDTQGRYLAHFSHNTPVDAIVQKLQQTLQP
jgi:cytochrome oxidase Cu insertion factor (SCO1/SenC/PrrC family)